MVLKTVLISALCGATLVGTATGAAIYNNLTPNNLMAIATRPGLAGVPEIEAGDDFLLTGNSVINTASFIGLIVPGPTGGSPTISDVVAEIYRVFPLDSTVPPSGNVPTRMNSPSDVAFDSRDSLAANLTFTTSVLNVSFTSVNSIKPGGIHQNTTGNGPVTGQEVQFNVTFLTPFSLPSDHYFFVPQVGVNNGGTFYWLSASRPISGAGTTPFAPDLQAWTRDSALDPDWLRVGTDIVGGGATAPTFNAAFSLDGLVVPEPSAMVLLAAGLAALSLRKYVR